MENLKLASKSDEDTEKSKNHVIFHQSQPFCCLIDIPKPFSSPFFKGFPLLPPQNYLKKIIFFSRNSLWKLKSDWKTDLSANPWPIKWKFVRLGGWFFFSFLIFLSINKDQWEKFKPDKVAHNRSKERIFLSFASLSNLLFHFFSLNCLFTFERKSFPFEKGN